MSSGSTALFWHVECLRWPLCQMHQEVQHPSSPNCKQSPPIDHVNRKLVWPGEVMIANHMIDLTAMSLTGPDLYQRYHGSIL